MVLWSLAQTDVTCRILIAYDIRKFTVVSAFCGLFDEARRHLSVYAEIRMPETSLGNGTQIHISSISRPFHVAHLCNLVRYFLTARVGLCRSSNNGKFSEARAQNLITISYSILKKRSWYSIISYSISIIQSFRLNDKLNELTILLHNFLPFM